MPSYVRQACTVSPAKDTRAALYGLHRDGFIRVQEVQKGNSTSKSFFLYGPTDDNGALAARNMVEHALVRAHIRAEVMDEKKSTSEATKGGQAAELEYVEESQDRMAHALLRLSEPYLVLSP